MAQRIKTSQEFNQFIAVNAQNPNIGNDIMAMRLACYEAIEQLRQRPLLIYASKFINALPNTPNNIDISDIDGFTDLVQSVRGKSKSIDVLLHSPGGQPDATERIVHILRNDFEEVHFIVPHSAYSAATMLALSGYSITLHPSATLGPIDPQINGTPYRQDDHTNSNSSRIDICNQFDYDSFLFSKNCWYSDRTNCYFFCAI